MVLVFHRKSNVYAEYWSFLMRYGCVYLGSRHGGANKMYVINQSTSKTCSAPFILIYNLSCENVAFFINTTKTGINF